MTPKFLDHGYIICTIIFTVLSQVIIRSQVSQAGDLPLTLVGKVCFVIQLLLNPWVVTGIVCTLFAGISWMLTISRFEMSYAFPWMSLNYVLMLLLGILIFGESFNSAKIFGTLFIIFGTVLITRS
jgi:multidrug transporter EmrE-like cation transporter